MRVTLHSCQASVQFGTRGQKDNGPVNTEFVISLMVAMCLYGPTFSGSL